MTTDIVERLRFNANAGIPDFTNSKLLDEAADQITRLRAALESILRDCEELPTREFAADLAAICMLINTARRALG